MKRVIGLVAAMLIFSIPTIGLVPAYNPRLGTYVQYFG
jgi:hypothetical protein